MSEHDQKKENLNYDALLIYIDPFLNDSEVKTIVLSQTSSGTWTAEIKY